MKKSSRYREPASKNGLTDKKWERLREMILARDDYLCQESKRYGKRIQAQCVHHIFPREYFPEWKYEPWNLISLSNQQHDRLHDRTSHKLSEKGWELLLRTARKNKIAIEDHWKEMIC